MTNLELLISMNGIQSKYLSDAQKLHEGKKKVNHTRYLRPLAAVLAAAVLLTAFFRTAPGASALTYLKDTVSNIIQTLFPPKEMTVVLEGEDETGNYEAGGLEPVCSTEYVEPGFAIYYDTNLYTMTEEGKITYIRPAGERDASLPVCEIAITHLYTSMEEAVDNDMADIDSGWDITKTTADNRIVLTLLENRVSWDSLIEERYYISDGQGGCFRIRSSYFTEASEGHGVRFSKMISTFTVISSDEAGN